MAKTTKAVKSANVALEAAAEAAKDAKRLSKTLPKKDAKKLRDLADEAKDIANAKKKQVKHNPRKVEKKAVAAIGRLEKAADKIEIRLAAEADVAKVSGIKSAAKAAEKDAKKAAKVAAGEPAAKDSEKPAVKAADTVPKNAPETGSSVDLSALTVIQLRAKARQAGHSGFSRLNKAQLIELLSV